MPRRKARRENPKERRTREAAEERAVLARLIAEGGEMGEAGDQAMRADWRRLEAKHRGR